MAKSRPKPSNIATILSFHHIYLHSSKNVAIFAVNFREFCPTLIMAQN